MKTSKNDKRQAANKIGFGQLPFGSLFELKTYCDERLCDESVINFNAGDHTISISIAYAEYARVEQPVIGCFATL